MCSYRFPSTLSEGHNCYCICVHDCSDSWEFHFLDGGNGNRLKMFSKSCWSWFHWRRRMSRTFPYVFCQVAYLLGMGLGEARPVYIDNTGRCVRAITHIFSKSFKEHWLVCKTKTCTDFGQMHNSRKCVRDCLLLHHGTQTQRRDEPQPVSSILKIPFLVQGHANQCHMFFSPSNLFWADWCLAR